MKLFPAITSLLLAPLSLMAADPVASARAALENQDYESVRESLSPLFDNSAPSRLSGEINYMMGAALFELGDYSASSPLLTNARAKGITDADLYLGRLAYLDYDLDKAEDLLDSFDSAKKRSDADRARSDSFRAQLEEGRQALTHVRDLKFIDKKIIPTEDFWNHIPLPPSAGVLLPPDSIPFKKGREEALIAFANEGRDCMIWSESDSLGNYRLVESLRLLGSGWSEPHQLPDALALGEETDYPFMRPDGTTLYFASSGPGSMGGMDLFVAYRDSRTGEFLKPANLGAPFNSPYDDLLLAVDEDNGIGWLVSDREQVAGRLTLYMFAFDENRTNVDPDTPDLLDRARITDKDILADDDPLKIEKMEALRHLSSPKRKGGDSISLRLTDGRTIRSLDELPYGAGRQEAARYLEALNEQEAEEAKLAELRRQYHALRSGSKKGEAQVELTKTAGAIQRLEKSVETRRQQLRILRNQLSSALRKS